MEFGSIHFLYFFFPFFFLIYYLLKEKWRNFWLCISSLLFVIYGRGSFAIYFFLITMLTYLGLSNLNHLPKNISKKKITIWIILLEVFIWFFFIKDIKVETLTIYPICYMIVLLSHIETVLDFYKNKRKSPKFFDYILYASCFSKLLFGPVLSYYNMEEEIKMRKIKKDNIIDGCFLFLRGLFQNILLMGMLSMLSAELFMISSSILATWTSIVTTMLQVALFMMSYSNMSLGISKMLGFNFTEETNYPLCLSKMKYFFSSWHYSISNFWDQHLKIKLPFIVQMFLFMILLAICYGFNYSIFLWFLFIGLGILIEEFYLTKKKIHRKLLITIHMIWIVISFSFLVKPNILETLEHLFTAPIWNDEIWYLLSAYFLILFISTCVVFKFGKKITHFLEKISWYPIVRMILYGLCLWLTLIAFISGFHFSIWMFRI